MKKTNAARLLDSLKIGYELLQYKVAEDDLSAEHVATQLGLPLEQVFKTIVVKGDKGGIVVCCIPGEGELDLKQVARLTGNKKVDLLPAKDILGVTGYLRGGCSPLAMKKHYPTYLDASVRGLTSVVVSAGLRGLQLCLGPDDLILAAQARVETLTLAGER